MQTARNEARLRAVGKFRQFLKEKVSIVETTKTERILKLEETGMAGTCPHCGHCADTPAA